MTMTNPLQLAQEQYSQVPFYRKNWFASILVLSGLLCGLPLMAACVIVLTGPVYMAEIGLDGKLKTWGAANKVVAVILLVAWSGYVLSRIAR